MSREHAERAIQSYTRWRQATVQQRAGWLLRDPVLWVGVAATLGLIALVFTDQAFSWFVLVLAVALAMLTGLYVLTQLFDRRPTPAQFQRSLKLLLVADGTRQVALKRYMDAVGYTEAASSARALRELGRLNRRLR